MPAPARAAVLQKDETVELSPFVVEATSDKSYGALNSNSITSFNTELEKLPISADVITKAFMDDTNSTTLENMLRTYSAGAGTGSAAGDVGGIPVNQPMDRGGGDERPQLGERLLGDTIVGQVREHTLRGAVHLLHELDPILHATLDKLRGRQSHLCPQVAELLVARISRHEAGHDERGVSRIAEDPVPIRRPAHDGQGLDRAERFDFDQQSFQRSVLQLGGGKGVRCRESLHGSGDGVTGGQEVFLIRFHRANFMFVKISDPAPELARSESRPYSSNLSRTPDVRHCISLKNLEPY